MPMPIHNVIAHRIQRVPGSNTQFQKRDSELPLDGKAEELLRELKRTYCNRAGKSWGLFSSDTGSYPFPALLKNHCEGNLGFASFTHKAAECLATELDKADAAVDAHLLVCQEKLADADYLYLFMVDHDEALYIDNELSIQSTWNIGSLMLGARVNLGEWQSGGSNYLSLLRLRGDKPLTDAFFNTLGFDDPQIDLYADTSQFLEAVDSYSKTLPEEQAQETRHKVVDYCIEQDRNAEPVVFEKLSRELNEKKPEEFAEFIEKSYEDSKGFEERAENLEPKKELIPHRGRLKQYIRLSGRDPEMSISFNADCIGNSVEYDHENDVLTLKKLPKALRSKLSWPAMGSLTMRHIRAQWVLNTVSPSITEPRSRAPVKSAEAMRAPRRSAPRRSAPWKRAPSSMVSRRSAPRRSARANKAPVRSDPAKLARWRLVSVKLVKNSVASVKSTSGASAIDRLALDRSNLANDLSCNSSPERSSP